MRFPFIIKSIKKFWSIENVCLSDEKFANCLWFLAKAETNLQIALLLLLWNVLHNVLKTFRAKFWSFQGFYGCFWPWFFFKGFFFSKKCKKDTCFLIKLPKFAILETVKRVTPVFIWLNFCLITTKYPSLRSWRYLPSSKGV